eukprot:517581-Rhodomonas_salina.1
MSLMKPMTHTPNSSRQCLSMTLTMRVKTQGANRIPKGRTVKQYIFPFHLKHSRLATGRQPSHSSSLRTGLAPPGSSSPS